MVAVDVAVRGGVCADSLRRCGSRAFVVEVRWCTSGESNDYTGEDESIKCLPGTSQVRRSNLFVLCS